MTSCTVECTSVPDGFASADRFRLRLSVILTPAVPNPANPAPGPAVDLGQWPTQVPGLSFQVWAGPSKSALKLVGTVPAGKAFEDDQTASISPHAQSWWSRLWQNPADLDAYLSLLNGGGSAVPTGPDTKVNGYDYSRLHQGAIDRTLEEFATAFASHAVRQGGKNLVQEFSGLALRAARDPNDPLVRIARALKWSALSSPPIPAPAVVDLAKSAVQPLPRGMAKGATLDADFARALDPQTTEVLLRAGGASAARAAARSTTAEQNDADFEQAMRNNEDLKVDHADPDALDQKLEYAHQVIGALQAHPALRKFARQIADIPLDTSALRAAFPPGAGDLKGVIAVEAVATGGAAALAPSALALFTAFELRSAGAALFEPCPEATFDGAAPTTPTIGAALPLRDGFVEPQAYGWTRRFQIASIDGIAAYYSRKRSEEATRKAYLRGALAADVPSEPTGFRTRGLMLLDLGAKNVAEAAEKRQASIATDRVLFAEDLVDGYRVDVVAPNGAVFPTCARTVEYHALDALDENLRQVYRTPRNDGFVSPLARTWTAPSSDPSKPADRHLSVSQVVFTWTGRPLGLPSGEIAEAQKASGEHQGLGVDYGFDPIRQGPILRIFGHYRFMLRARKLNGSSVPSSAARVGEFALGSDDDKLGRMLATSRNSPDPGYQFGLVEKAPAPTLLVPDGFVGGEGVDPADRENVGRIIVRTGSNDTKVRWLASPLVGFDLAEIQGQFDPLSASKPDRDKAADRAKFGAYRYLVHDAATGAFPTIKDGPATVALVMQTARPPTDPPLTPYFIDATLRTVGALLKGDKSTPSQAIDASTLKSDPAFFPPATPRGMDAGSVVPIRVEVRALGRDGVSTIRNGQPFPLKLPHPSGRTINCPTICIDVAPADSLRLELWSNRTPEAFQANPAIAAATEGAWSTALGIGALLEPGSRSSHELYGALVRNQRVASLSDVTAISIEHPVSRSLDKPSVTVSLAAFRATDATSWEAVVLKGNGADVPDAAKIYATGHIHVDRKSTGEVWAEAFWVEVASKDRVFRNSKPEVFGRVEQSNLFERKTPTQFRRLFSIESLELPEIGIGESAEAYLRRINEIDLLLQDHPPSPAGGPSSSRKPRFLSADFDCDQHRVLAVRLVARSRFAPPDAPAPPPAGMAPTPGGPAIPEPAEPSEDTTYLKQSASRDACRAAIERGNWAIDGVFRIDMPATRRPPAPYVTRDKGTFYQRVLRTSADGSETSLIHNYRCWLDGDWFASGPGEKLAIVCRQPGAALLPDWADAQVSRWGGDGTSVPGHRLWMQNGLSEDDATYLSADQIGGEKPDQTVIWKDDKDPRVTAQVALACIEPRFHTGYGRWYCDIELKPTGAYKAAVKLVLARYQKDALAGRTLSRTVPIDAVMVHQPWSFSAKRKSATIEVTVTGPAYRGRAPMLDKMDGVSQGQPFKVLSDLIGDTRALPMDHLAQAPLIVAELERLDPRGSGPMPALIGGLVVASTSLGVQPQRVPENVESFVNPVMLSRWTLSLAIPPEDAGKPLAVRVGLSSAHANSQARHPRLAGVGVGRDGASFQPSALDGEIIYLPEPIVVQLLIENLKSL
ncbi:hypothetical protein [Lichenibacterium ramalinae]|uniref:Uncharacterized protein n=1 Tax=Lichenibacterium ramalinae TaxID=2316527 RepID=A0A4Q2RF19_9HYPH|nr:hypothetical protein [Lichenibacterium ramalinae]RYB05783.1 hypothetical protein D3272_09405 [Lichenibacterium ramalinae]